MKTVKHRVKSGRVILYPISCWHIGARQSDQDFIQGIIRLISYNKHARWIYMGDGGDCVTTVSKGSVFEQTMPPDEQLHTLHKLLEPIRDKGLLGIKGNHGARLIKVAGFDWDQELMKLLRLPYCGTSAYLELTVGKKKFEIFAQHGTGNQISPWGKMEVARKPSDWITADLILTGHTHACGEVWPPRVFYDGARWRRTHMFVCGSAYDGRSGYGEDLMYPPLLPEHIEITLSDQAPCVGFRIIRKELL